MHSKIGRLGSSLPSTTQYPNWIVTTRMFQFWCSINNVKGWPLVFLRRADAALCSCSSICSSLSKPVVSQPSWTVLMLDKESIALSDICRQCGCHSDFGARRGKSAGNRSSFTGWVPTSRYHIFRQGITWQKRSSSGRLSSALIRQTWSNHQEWAQMAFPVLWKWSVCLQLYVSLHQFQDILIETIWIWCQNGLLDSSY